MLVYRIAQEHHSLDLSGDGARKFGGRWNPKGKPVLYTAESPSLAMLECLAHYAITGAPAGLVLVTIEIPDGVSLAAPELAELPADWSARPEKPSSVQFGSLWLNAARAAVLRVPSVVAPEGYGWNYLLNPLHPELNDRISILSAVPWQLDARIAQRLPKP